MKRCISALFLICAGMVLGFLVFAIPAVRAALNDKVAFSAFSSNLSMGTCVARTNATAEIANLRPIRMVHGSTWLFSGHFPGGETAALFCVGPTKANQTIVIRAVIGSGANLNPLLEQIRPAREAW